MEKEHYDVLVVGAGIVGCATAHSVAKAGTCFHLHQAAYCSFTGHLLTSFTLTLVSMAPAAGDGTGLPALSIVGSFSPLPGLEYAVARVVPPPCHLALAAARAPLVALRRDAQHDRKLATIPVGPGVGAGFAVAQLRRASAVMP